MKTILIIIFGIINLFTLSHYFLQSKNIEPLNSFVKVTKLPGFAIGANYLENRFLPYDSYSTTVIPFLKNSTYSDMIYK